MERSACGTVNLLNYMNANGSASSNSIIYQVNLKYYKTIKFVQCKFHGEICFVLNYPWRAHRMWCVWSLNAPHGSSNSKSFVMNFLCNRSGTGNSNKKDTICTWEIDLLPPTRYNPKSHHLTNNDNMFRGCVMRFSFRVDTKLNWLYNLIMEKSLDHKVSCSRA